MKKQLIFFIRYFTTSQRWKRWVNARSIAIAAISALLILLVVWTSPQSASRSQANASHINIQAAQSATVTAAGLSLSPTPSAEPTRTRTPFPPEFYTNQKETDGITLAGTLLVLIAVIGVLVFFPKRDES